MNNIENENLLKFINDINSVFTFALSERHPFASPNPWHSIPESNSLISEIDFEQIGRVYWNFTNTLDMLCVDFGNQVYPKTLYHYFGIRKLAFVYAGYFMSQCKWTNNDSKLQKQTLDDSFAWLLGLCHHIALKRPIISDAFHITIERFQYLTTRIRQIENGAILLENSYIQTLKQTINYTLSNISDNQDNAAKFLILFINYFGWIANSMPEKYSIPQNIIEKFYTTTEYFSKLLELKDI